MKYSEFKRWLEQQGAILHPAKGSHFKAMLNGRQTIFPNHGAKEMPKPLVGVSRKTWG